MSISYFQSYASERLSLEIEQFRNKGVYLQTCSRETAKESGSLETEIQKRIQNQLSEKIRKKRKDLISGALMGILSLASLGISTNKRVKRD